MKINCSKWPYTSFLIPAYQKIVIAKKADFHARRTSRSAHDRLANILRTHAVWTSGERNAIMARRRLYNRNFGPRATITLRARSLMFYNRLSRSAWCRGRALTFKTIGRGFAPRQRFVFFTHSAFAEKDQQVGVV